MVCLTSNGIVKRLLGQMAGLVRRVENLVVEDREVEGKAQADGVGRGELGLGNLGGRLVGLEGLVGRVLALVANGELGEVAVVVTLPATLLDPKGGWGRKAGRHTSCGRTPWIRRS